MAEYSLLEFFALNSEIPNHLERQKQDRSSPPEVDRHRDIFL